MLIYILLKNNSNDNNFLNSWTQKCLNVWSGRGLLETIFRHRSGTLGEYPQQQDNVCVRFNEGTCPPVHQCG